MLYSQWEKALFSLNKIFYNPLCSRGPPVSADFAALRGIDLDFDADLDSDLEDQRIIKSTNPGCRK